MVAIRVTSPSLERLQRTLTELVGELNQTETLADQIGAVVESQTRRRISEEKESPDGEEWAAWSDAYAEKRPSGVSLLQGGQQHSLLESIEYQVSGSEVVVGSNLVYAAIHQFGGEDVGKPSLPARPYLGLSQDNEDELMTVVEDWVSQRITEAQG